jgi:hypothetical protein
VVKELTNVGLCVVASTRPGCGAGSNCRPVGSSFVTLVDTSGLRTTGFAESLWVAPGLQVVTVITPTATPELAVLELTDLSRLS